MLRVIYGLMYRIGFTPWDGHPLPPRLLELGDAGKGRAIDLGCGTGDAAIHLARRGWEVVGVDFVERALQRARAKGDAAGASVRWLRADVTQLSSLGVGNFSLLVDSGLLHGLDDRARMAYVRELAAIAEPDAALFVVAFLPGARRPGPRGIVRAEIERLFSPGWRLAGDGKVDWSGAGAEHLRWYELRRMVS